MTGETQWEAPSTSNTAVTASADTIAEAATVTLPGESKSLD